MTKYSVWVGGVETNDHHLTREQAVQVANEWRADGYTDVAITSDTQAACDGCGAPIAYDAEWDYCSVWEVTRCEPCLDSLGA